MLVRVAKNPSPVCYFCRFQKKVRVFSLRQTSVLIIPTYACSGPINTVLYLKSLSNIQSYEKYTHANPCLNHINSLTNRLLISFKSILLEYGLHNLIFLTEFCFDGKLFNRNMFYQLVLMNKFLLPFQFFPVQSETCFSIKKNKYFLWLFYVQIIQLLKILHPVTSFNNEKGTSALLLRLIR